MKRTPRGRPGLHNVSPFPWRLPALLLEADRLPLAPPMSDVGAPLIAGPHCSLHEHDVLRVDSPHPARIGDELDQRLLAVHAARVWSWQQVLPEGDDVVLPLDRDGEARAVRSLRPDLGDLHDLPALDHSPYLTW